MKQIAPNELYANFSGFLKSKGITLTDGSYADGLRKSCSLLTDAINLGQESIERAKKEFGKNCQHLRQVIHEKTAPKPAANGHRARTKPAPPKAKVRPTTSKSAAPKNRKPRPKRRG